jgi:hypothetical protein
VQKSKSKELPEIKISIIFKQQWSLIILGILTIERNLEMMSVYLLTVTASNDLELEH